MHRQELLTLLSNHQTRFIEESAYLTKAKRFVEMHADCFNRDLSPAHVTGSAWVVSPDRSQVLMMHHRKHGQWFQPGGHADGDADILRVALRETSEETSLDPAQIRLLGETVFDVDIHTIQASVRGPQHQHIDVRFLVEIDNDLQIPGNDESHEIRWVDLIDVTRFNNNRSTYRMMEKTRHLRNTSVHSGVR